MLRALVLQAPPNVVEGWSARSIAELARAAAVGDRLRRLSMPDRRALLDLFTKSAGDYLDGWFESEPVKALFGFDAVVGNYASPYAPGSAYVLLHHVFGEVNGKKGVWGHALGGMGAISEAIARAARAAGAEIETGAPVRASHRRERPRRRRHPRRRAGDPRRHGRRERQSEAPLRPHGAERRRRGRFRRPHGALALRLRHLPDERRAVAASELHRPARLCACRPP